METDRRKTKRSQGDQFMRQALATLRGIEKLSKGEVVDYTEYYVDLVAMKDRLGRRHEDHKLGEWFCVTIESIGSNIENLLKKQSVPRLVKITKAGRNKRSQEAIHTSIGWEAEEPRVGKNYRLFKEDGGVFHSAQVTEVTSDCFQTQNSLYRIEVLP